jgi:hypothetical protein
VPQPTPYDREFDFTDFQAGSPSAPPPGFRLDAEFNGLKVTTDEIRDSLALIQRDDGKLADGSVTADAVDPSLILEIAQSVSVDASSVAQIFSATVAPGRGGVFGDGVGNDAAAIAALHDSLPAGQSLELRAGSYRIGASVTFTRPVHFRGGRLIIANGVTVSFDGGISAVPEQIFQTEGTGEVVFDHRKTFRGYAEWWGARPDQSVDCLPAIHASIKALLVTQLLGGDYVCSSTVKVNLAHRKLIGVGSKFTDSDAEVTRILSTSDSLPILQHGADVFTGSINTLPSDIVVQDIFCARNVVPSIASNCAGVLAKFSLSGRLENVKSAESMVGFRYNGTVHLVVRDCEAVRATAGTGAGVDFFIGHWADGSGNIGAAGGNASLYVLKCTAGCNHPTPRASGQSIGFRIDGAFTDVFMEDPETVTFNVGLAVLGNDAAGNVFTNTDCRIVHPVMDQFSAEGIVVVDVGATGSVEIHDAYCGPSATATSAIHVNSSAGAVRFNGGQLVMGGVGTCRAVLIESSDNVDLDIDILEAGNTHPVVAIGGASNCRIRPRIKNKVVAAGAAIQLSGVTSANVIEPMISGSPGLVQFGVQVVGVADSRNDYRVGGIDTACLVAATRTLDRNGVVISSDGNSGTNKVSGRGGDHDLPANGFYRTGGKRILSNQQINLSSVATALVSSVASCMLLLRDTVHGGSALVFYENAAVPVLIANSGNFVTGAPAGTQIQLRSISGANLGIEALMAAGQTATVSVTIMSAQDV